MMQCLHYQIYRSDLDGISFHADGSSLVRERKAPCKNRVGAELDTLASVSHQALPSIVDEPVRIRLSHRAVFAWPSFFVLEL